MAGEAPRSSYILFRIAIEDCDVGMPSMSPVRCMGAQHASERTLDGTFIRINTSHHVSIETKTDDRVELIFLALSRVRSCILH